MEIGRKLYYDLATGDIVQDTGERGGSVIETTLEQDFAAYKALNERVPETVGMLQLDYGQYAEDFAQASGYRVNVETGELDFSYPDPNEDPEQPQEPIYQVPLSAQVAVIATELSSAQLALTDTYEQLLIAQGDATSAQVALADLYELTLNLLADITALKGGES